jgi:predicted DCC family thiol-disulfide oxidoreductase YuxK
MTLTHEIEVFYDGGCPLCVREIGMLKKWDRHQKILFTDIDAPEFQSLALEKSYDELMSKMHARLPNGTWLTGVEVFRQLYSAVGFKYSVLLSRLPLISHLLNAGYWLFAKNRLRLTGRCLGKTCQVKSTR